MAVKIPSAELVAIEALKVDNQNPNVMSEKQLLRLKTSIQKYGFIIPIITNKDLLIADGEQRLTVAKSLGMTEVPVVRLPVKDVDRRLLRQVLNKLKGEHDFLRDAEEFMRIIKAGEKDSLKALLDLNDSSLEKYLREINPPKDEDFEVPEIDKIQTSIKRGDIIQLGTHRIMCGDATSKEDVEKLMNGKKASLNVTSPPYWIGKEYEKQRSIKEVIAFINNACFNMACFTESDGRIVINSSTGKRRAIEGEKARREELLIIDWWRDALALQNWFIIHLRMWIKSGGFPGRIPPTQDFVDQHCEFIMNFYNPNGKWKGQNRLGLEEFKEGTEWVSQGVWTFAGEKQKLHPAPFPIELPKRHILLYSNNSDIILDLFGGSGSTLIACEQTGRVCYMMEISEKYCEVICRRFEAYTGQKRELLQ